MGAITLPPPAKLIAGILIHHPEERWDPLRQRLTASLGPIEDVKEMGIFTKTRYYEKEMGTPLYRYFLSFAPLVRPETLPHIKYATNAIEAAFLNEQGGRTVNIDPGILTLQNLILATTKNYTHRIYLDKGIFADLTLIFQKGEFQPLPWTYPDYRDAASRAFFLEVRNRYKIQLKEVLT